MTSSSSPSPPHLLCPATFHPHHSSIGTASFIISADKAAREFELQKYATGSGTELERISHEQQRLEQEAGIAPGQKAPRGQVSTKEAVIEWAKENRWTAVGVT